MRKSMERPWRRVRPSAQPEPGYPALREHMASRRDVLTFVGASLATGVLSACLGGKPPNPNYHSFRLPGTGELETTLASGESCRFYVNGSYYGELQDDYDALDQLCIDTLAERTASDLATSEGRWAAEQALHDALYPQLPNLDYVSLTVVSL
jgi:hypothetical protein